MVLNREYFVETLKSCGQEIIDRAEDYVGNTELMTDMDIWIRLRGNEAPEINCSRTYMSGNTMKLIASDRI